MRDITISIIIPIYNAERHLEECLESCIHQTLETTEIICINDGSTDNTVKILNQYAQEYENVVILEQENQGAGVARNLGMRYARGQYIAFMDSDDYYPDNNVLNKLYAAAVQENALICGGTLYFQLIGASQLESSIKFQFNENKKIYYKNYQHSYGFTQYIYKTDFLKNNGIEFPLWRQYEDPPFLVETMVKAQTFYAISDVVYVARNTDKVIRYTDKDILIGVLKGIRYILSVSKMNRYEILHTDIVVKFMKYIGYVYQLIYNGDLVIRKIYDEILYDIDATLLAEDPRQIKKPEALTDKEIKQIVGKSLERERKLLRKMNLFETVLIYGAGRAGRTLYDYIKKRNYNGKVEFVVSSENPRYMACGKPVKCIYNYINYKDNVLVLIANQDSVKEMEENAKKYGFKNIEKIPYDELKLFGADISTNDYITIY